MIRLERSPLYGSVVALALTAVALLLTLLLRPLLEPDIFLLFLVVVWLSTWYYGLTMGLAARGASALAVLATDEHGRLTFLNPVAEALTGWSGLEARKKAVADVLRLIDERTRQAIDNPLLRALRERAMVTTGEHIALISRSGAEVPV